MRVPINEIVVGDRRREDYGNIDNLAKSITTFGLIQPIVVDKDYNLIAGGRRLMACQKLGWVQIEAEVKGLVTEEERHGIEFEENVMRKNFTDYELSKRMDKAAEKATEILKKDFSANTAKKVNDSFCAQRKNPGGRPPKDGVSESKVAEAIGVPLTTLREAKAHVEAVEKYPELETWNKKEAIRVAKELDQAPEPKREEALQRIKNFNDDSKKRFAEIDLKHKVFKLYQDAIYKPSLLEITEQNVAYWIDGNEITAIQVQLSVVEDAIKKLVMVRDIIKSKLSGPRLVKRG